MKLLILPHLNHRCLCDLESFRHYQVDHSVIFFILDLIIVTLKFWDMVDFWLCSHHTKFHTEEVYICIANNLIESKRRKILYR